MKSQYKKGEAIVDEDGFTLVVRGGAYGQSVGGGVAVASKPFKKGGEEGGRGRRGKKKKEPKEKEKFYAFQVHEKKRDGELLIIFSFLLCAVTDLIRKRVELIKLKRDWESDKAKVNKLRQERKFKPY
jgi:ribosomal RNA-processing protein 7